MNRLSKQRVRTRRLAGLTAIIYLILIMYDTDTQTAGDV